MAANLKLGLLAAALIMTTTGICAVAEASERHRDRGHHSGWQSRSIAHGSYSGRGRSSVPDYRAPGWRGSDDGRQAHRRDRRDDRHRDNGDHGGGRYGDRGYSGGAYVGGDGLPSIIPGVGTFAGGLSAMRVRGNGIYFSSDLGSTGDADRRSLPLQPKIIHIDQDVASGEFLAYDDCQYEAGVCVIRGTN
jgi:hypothetical protein